MRHMWRITSVVFRTMRIGKCILLLINAFVVRFYLSFLYFSVSFPLSPRKQWDTEVDIKGVSLNRIDSYFTYNDIKVEEGV